MHSTYARINNISAMLSTALMCLLGAITLSSFVFTANPRGSVEISSVQVCVLLHAVRPYKHPDYLALSSPPDVFHAVYLFLPRG